MRKIFGYTLAFILASSLLFAGASRVIDSTKVRNGSGSVSIPSATNVTANEVSYLSGVTSAIQTQINALGSGFALLNASNIFSIGNQLINIGATTQVGMTIKSFSISQSANLLELKNSLGTVIGRGDTTGFISNGTQVAFISEQQPLTTVGGACSTADNTIFQRILNTIFANDTGITLGNSTMTIPIGTWHFYCQVPGEVTLSNRYVAELYDNTNSVSKAASGCVGQAGSATTGSGAFIDCSLTFGASTGIIVREKVQTESATNTCLGTSAGAASVITGFDHETYTQCRVTRLK